MILIEVKLMYTLTIAGDAGDKIVGPPMELVWNYLWPICRSYKNNYY